MYLPVDCSAGMRCQTTARDDALASTDHSRPGAAVAGHGPGSGAWTHAGLGSDHSSSRRRERALGGSSHVRERSQGTPYLWVHADHVSPAPAQVRTNNLRAIPLSVCITQCSDRSDNCQSMNRNVLEPAHRQHEPFLVTSAMQRDLPPPPPTLEAVRVGACSRRALGVNRVKPVQHR
jgi:hypothetical protein